MENTIEQLRYPIGKFTCPEKITQNHITEWINVLDTLPKRLENMVKDLSVEQLEIGRAHV